MLRNGQERIIGRARPCYGITVYRCHGHNVPLPHQQRSSPAGYSTVNLVGACLVKVPHTLTVFPGPRLYLAALGTAFPAFLPLFFDFLPLPPLGGPEGPATKGGK